jgi:hypothetical protein
LFQRDLRLTADEQRTIAKAFTGRLSPLTGSARIVIAALDPDKFPVLTSTLRDRR